MKRQQNNSFLAAGFVALALAASSLPAAAQMPGAPPPRGKSPQLRYRDPTQPSPEMREAIEATQAVPSPTSPAVPGVPQIKLKAKLIGSVGKPVAVLDVDGQQFIVHADSEIDAPMGGGSKIMVRELTAGEVRLEMLPLKRIVVLR